MPSRGHTHLCNNIGLWFFNSLNRYQFLLLLIKGFWTVAVKLIKGKFAFSHKFNIMGLWRATFCQISFLFKSYIWFLCNRKLVITHIIKILTSIEAIWMSKRVHGVIMIISAHFKKIFHFVLKQIWLFSVNKHFCKRQVLIIKRYYIPYDFKIKAKISSDL